MKGSAAHWIIIGLCIGAIVIAVALGPLQYLSALELDLFTDKTKLVRYSTCSLALCANGVGSPQVDKVGCLEREDGQCVKSCRDVGEEFKEFGERTFADLEGTLHFCGEQNALEFEFDNSIPISIRSGEMQSLANPKWACEGARLGHMMIGGSQNFQKDVLGECVMMSAFNSELESGFHNWFNLHVQAPGAVGRECFDGFRSVMFTPLMPYEDIEDAFYPSALYLDGEFRAECELSGGGPVYTGDSADSSNADTEGETLPTFSQCSIATADGEGKKKFRVWSKNVVNKPYLEAILGDDFDVTTPIAQIFQRVKDISVSAYSTVNTCAITILSLEEGLETDFAEKQRLIGSAEQLHPALASYGEELHLYFQESDSFDRTKLTSSAIKSVNLVDGKFETLDKAQIVKGYDGHKYIEPSVTVLGGHRYLAYAADTGESGTWEIFVEDLETGDVSQVTHAKKDLTSELNYLSPSIASFGGKLYLVAHQETKIFTSTTIEIIFAEGTVADGEIEWEKIGIIPNEDLRGNGDNSFPSITATSEGLMVTYSFRDATKLGFEDESHPSIGALIFENGGWKDAGVAASGRVDTESSGRVQITNNGFSHIFSDNGNTLVFFAQGSGLPSDFNQRKIVYSRYLGNGMWSEPATAADSGDLMASAALFNGVTVLAFSELVGVPGNFDLVIATEGGRSLIPEETVEQELQIGVKSDKENYASGETIVFSGMLEINGEPAAGEDVTIELTQMTNFGPLLKGGKVVTTDASGSFTWQTEIELSAETDTVFEVLAKYGRLESEPYRFTVG